MWRNGFVILCVLAFVFVACDDDGGKDSAACEVQADCADNADGKTVCDVEAGECVAPATRECEGDAD